MGALHDLYASYQPSGLGIQHGVYLFASTAIGLWILSIIIGGIKNIYFHPLSHIPGPKLWIAFPFVRFAYSLFGVVDERHRYYHEIWGPTIRVAPNELSFTDHEAWNDIHGFHSGPELPRSMSFHPAPANDIIRADTHHHGRFRKALAYGFSDRALRNQEDLIRGYVDLLIAKFSQASETGSAVNLTRWFNFFTFDLIGDLAYGQSFDCLKTGEMHFYIENLLKALPTRPIVSGANDYPILAFLFKHILMSNSVKEVRRKMTAFATSTISARLNDGAKQGRADFIDAMSRHKGTDAEITEPEMVSNALIILAAGSETTATTLTGATYFLLRHPHALARATREVRAAFPTEAAITIAATTAATLPYTLACLEETFRMYPPVLGSNARVTVQQPSTSVAGLAVPRGVSVGVHHSAAYWSSRNFARPREYVPERWLKENQAEGGEFAGDRRAVLQPFTVGPRNCIGKNLAWAEVRVVLARMLWRFDLGFEDDGAARGWERQRAYTVWVKKPLMVRFEARKDV